MKRIIGALLLAVCSLAQAQFAPNTVLRAQDLNNALAHPTITGGSINGAPIGASVPAGITATTIRAGTITAAAIIGSVSSVATANTATNVSGASQPSITSLGTLTGLAVTTPIVGSVTGSAASATTATNVNGGTANVTTLTASGAASLGTISTSLIRTGAGSLGTPSHSFTGDTNSGLYSFSPGYVGMATGGVQAALFGPSSTVFSGSVDIPGTMTVGLLNGTLSGTATTALTLGNTRTIDGVGFNGSTNITVIATATHAATAKTTPVNADELPLVDSAASNTLKKLLWQDLLATAKTYFDTLYQPAGGGAPGLVLLSSVSVTSTSVTSVDFTSGIDSTYDEYVLELVNVTGTGTNFAVFLRTSSDGGVSFDAGASDYAHASLRLRSDIGIFAADNSSADTKVQLIVQDLNNTASNGGMNGTVRMFGLSSAVRWKNFTFQSSGIQAGSANLYSQTGSGIRFSTSAVNAVRIIPSGGSWAYGLFKLYGLRK